MQELDAHTSSYNRIVLGLNARRKLNSEGADELDNLIAELKHKDSSWDAQFAAHTRTNKYCLE